MEEIDRVAAFGAHPRVRRSPRIGVGTEVEVCHLEAERLVDRLERLTVPLDDPEQSGTEFPERGGSDPREQADVEIGDTDLDVLSDDDRNVAQQVLGEPHSTLSGGEWEQLGRRYDIRHHRVRRDRIRIEIVQR
ncbi:hypothetical protein MLGJGCBP_03095 [Rhodococcus sp. T7]|nr:hypothetical protein MLGJGCBP_03095 [Rhodococcus sp. T7]